MKEDIACKIVENVRICADRNHNNPFQQTKEIHTIMRENNKYYLKFANKCKIQGFSCFSSNLHNLSFYFIIYLVAAIIVNFFHEAFHFCVFYFSGEDTSGFQFGFNLGSTFIGELPLIKSHTIFWWYLAIMGPLLFVNFLSIAIAYLAYRPRSSYRLFLSGSVYSERIFEMFLRAIAYISALSILINTIMSPLMQLLSIDTRYSGKSDFMWGWGISLKMSTEVYQFSKYYIWIFIVITIFLIVIIMKSNFKLQNLGITLIILVSTSIIFFIAGISDRNLFQWMMITSVTLEIIFSMIYILRFGKKVD